MNFNPDYRTPPGATFKETVDYLKLGQQTASTILGIPEDMLEHFYEGRLPLTTEMAQNLERFLMIPAKFWLDMEKNWRKQ